MIKSSLILLIGLFPVAGLSQITENLQQLLERIRVNEVKHFSYRETREMQLLNIPWEGRGTLFITPERVLILQQMPKKTLVSITEKRMAYREPGADVKRMRPLSSPYDVPGIGKLLQLMYGVHGTKSIEEDYEVTLRFMAGRWLLRLAPRKLGKFQIDAFELAGDDQADPDLLRLEYVDGDETQWHLSLQSHGLKADEALKTVLKSLEKP